MWKNLLIVYIYYNLKGFDLKRMLHKQIMLEKSYYYSDLFLYKFFIWTQNDFVIYKK